MSANTLLLYQFLNWNKMVLQIQLIGISFILLGAIHVIFPKYFKWKIELKKISLINKEMMVVHTFFVAFGVVLMGVLCLSSAEELLTTKLGQKIGLGLCLFWGVRLIVQFFGYSSELWKGKTFETIVHVLFSIFWFYLTVVFGMVYFR
jgi:hypothetical protein